MDITWENCTLRSWLNNDFYYKAFSASDRKKIVTVHNENPDSYELYKRWGTHDGAKGGNATDNKVFLLSWTEARDYLDGKPYDHDSSLAADKYNQKLLCRPTAYTNAQGLYIYYNDDSKYYPSDTDGCCCWWLRSPGYDQSSAARVYYTGALEGPLSSSHFGVRPALLID